jgi:hypothetical protein
MNAGTLHHCHRSLEPSHPKKSKKMPWADNKALFKTFRKEIELPNNFTLSSVASASLAGSGV